ncbi:MAG: DsbA family protein [Alphaproteobacteria bacterium]|nr:DsbA family protein [Alphaproteobacteria bacterium]
MFEQIIKKVSSIIAGIVVFSIAGGVYLSSKGFEWNGKDGFVLVSKAYAADTVAGESDGSRDVSANFGFPKDHVMGDEKAPVTLYEYSSFGCFHCAEFHLNVLPEIKKNYIEKGFLKLVFVPMPLDKNSMDGALLAECVDNDKYFSFVDVLFKKQRDWSLAFNPQKVLLQYAALSGLGNEKAQVCLKNDVTAARILKDRKDGLEILKIQGTPSFFVSSSKGNEAIDGLRPYEDFARVIDSHLNISEKDKNK